MGTEQPMQPGTTEAMFGIPTRKPRRVVTVGVFAFNLIECWALAEIVWYYTHDGETLHGAVADYVRGRIAHHAEISRALQMIRDLPE